MEASSASLTPIIVIVRIATAVVIVIIEVSTVVKAVIASVTAVWNGGRSAYGSSVGRKNARSFSVSILIMKFNHTFGKDGVERTDLL